MNLTLKIIRSFFTMNLTVKIFAAIKRVVENFDIFYNEFEKKTKKFTLNIYIQLYLKLYKNTSSRVVKSLFAKNSTNPVRFRGAS